MSTSTNDTTAPSGRPISVLERARALEARSSCGTAKPVVGPNASRAATFVSKVAGANSTSGTGSVGAPPRRGPAGAAPSDTSRTSRYASIARLLDDAGAEKSAHDVRGNNSSLAPTKIAAQSAPHGKSSGASTSTTTTTKKKQKQSLGAKIASDKSRSAKNNRAPSSTTSGASASSKSTTPAFLSRAVASWNRTERHFDRLDDSDPSSSSEEEEEEGGANDDDDIISDDDADDGSKASTDCTGSTHTSVTNSFTAASLSSVTTIGGDTAAGHNSEGASPRRQQQYEPRSDSETDDDDELSGYSWSRVGISTRPVSIDSPPQVIRSKVMPKQATSTGSAELHFPGGGGGDQSSDEETAIHDNTTTAYVPPTKIAPSSSPASPSTSSNDSVDSTKATVTKQPPEASLADQQSVAVVDDEVKLKPLWQCRLEDMRMRQGLAEELMAAVAPLPPPPRTELPARMHRQVVAGEEDWSKDFAEETFVAFNDDIFGRREI